MELHSRSAGAVAVLQLAGRFDAYSAPAVAEWLEPATAAAPARVVVNLAGVTFVDSTALGTLVQGMKQSRRHGGDVHLCGLQRPVRIIFELTRLDSAPRLFADEDEAIAAFP
jgi:anti-sigma B factor antagonist